MFRTRGRKIIRDVLARKGRTALVSIAIFIGVAGTIALFSLSDILVTQLRKDIKEDELPMIQVFLTVNAGQELDNASYAQTLTQTPGVTELVGGVETLVQFKTSESDEDFDEGQVMAYQVLNEETGELEDKRIDELRLQPGRLIEGDFPRAGENEIALESRMAEEQDLGVGDSIYLRILSPDAAGEIGTTEAYTVSGIVFHAYSQTPKTSLYTYVADANRLGGTTGWNTIKVRFTDFETAEDRQEEFANTIANQTPYVPAFIFAEDPAQNSQIQGAQTIGLTMGFLALVALIVSGFLVINVISSIVVEQKRQIGVMKSMGATAFDNFIMYSGIAFTYGLIGVVPGVIVGILGGHFASQGLAPTLNTVLEGFGISPFSIILGILIGLMVPVLASIIPVWSATRVRILEAMTDLGINARYGSGPLAKIIGRLPFPTMVRQGLSNISIKKSRLIFTVITLAIAVGAFMGIFAVFSSLTGAIDLFLNSYNVEIAVFPNEGRDPEEITSILRENFQTPENNIIDNIEPGFQLQVEFEGYEPVVSAGGPPGIFAYGYDINSADPAFNFTIDEGEPLTDENAANGIIFSDLLASNMDVGIGDTVTMKVPGNTIDLNIVGISEFPLDQVWLDWRTLALVSNYTAGAPTPNQYFSTVQVEGFTSEAGNNEVAIAGFDQQPANFIPIQEGSYFSEDQPGVIISTQLAENGNYAVGDTLTLSATTADGSTVEAPVVGIFQLPPQLQQEEGIPAEAIVMDWMQLATLEGISLQGEPRPQGYFLTTTLNDPSAARLDDVIEDINDVMLNNGIAVQSFNFVDLVDQISQIFFIFQAVLQAVAFLIALVGALGLLTTLSMSVFERQKEIGVMRSIGAGSSVVAGQFLTEGLVVGVIAWIVGLPVGYAIELLLLNVTGFDETFPAVFPITAPILGLVGMLVITTIASLWPSLSAARKTVSDILRYQ